MEEKIVTIQPIILSGGAGTRLWPLSREAYPKQFLKLFGEHSLLQQTCLRVGGEAFDPPVMLVNNDHRFLVGEQLQDIGVTANAIVLEPAARNTGPAALVAALMAAGSDGDNVDNDDKLVLLLPSDHLVDDSNAFVRSVMKGADAARDGHIVTFGVTPEGPETGFGYIEASGQGGDAGALDVVRFVEKPTREVAQGYLDTGNYYWNAGIFLFSAGAMIEAFESLAPGLVEPCRTAVDTAVGDLDFLRLDADAYGRCENISLDYAIMEKASGIKCVPLETSWSDLGAWPAMWDAAEKDSDGNAAIGDVMLKATRNSYAYTDDAALCVLGLDDVLVVATRDAILVASKEHAQAVKDVVAELKAKGRDEAVIHRRVYRPWGWYEGLSSGDRFQVKCIMVKPGGRLSLQSHMHRSEHWVVVSGTAQVTVGEETVLMSENESTYIPLGAKHRLENPGKVPAFMIEVQSGRYLGEDDIVRYEDVYNRD